jgi:hypothetical protein
MPIINQAKGELARIFKNLPQINIPVVCAIGAMFGANRLSIGCTMPWNFGEAVEQLGSISVNCSAQRSPR